MQVDVLTIDTCLAHGAGAGLLGCLPPSQRPFAVSPDVRDQADENWRKQ